MTTTIKWDRAMLSRFKCAYRYACATSRDTFMFEGNEFVLNYARYLIEYLESSL